MFCYYLVWSFLDGPPHPKKKNPPSFWKNDLFYNLLSSSSLDSYYFSFLIEIVFLLSRSIRLDESYYLSIPSIRLFLLSTLLLYRLFSQSSSEFCWSDSSLSFSSINSDPLYSGDIISVFSKLPWLLSDSKTLLLLLF